MLSTFDRPTSGDLLRCPEIFLVAVTDFAAQKDGFGDASVQNLSTLTVKRQPPS